MGLIDRITGKAKQAAGDKLGDASLRRQGRLEERKGKAKQDLTRHEERIEHEREHAEEEKARAEMRAEDRVAEHDERAQRKAQEIADLERRTR
jgi:uncharacterized protein YjbJ (UPF0337 family)